MYNTCVFITLAFCSSSSCEKLKWNIWRLSNFTQNISTKLNARSCCFHFSLSYIIYILYLYSLFQCGCVVVVLGLLLPALLLIGKNSSCEKVIFLITIMQKSKDRINRMVIVHRGQPIIGIGHRFSKI